MHTASSILIDFNVGSGKLLTILNIITHYCVSIERKTVYAVTVQKSQNNMLQKPFVYSSTDEILLEAQIKSIQWDIIL